MKVDLPKCTLQRGLTVKATYVKQNNGGWKKRKSEPMKTALKRLIRSQNISVEYLNKVSN